MCNEFTMASPLPPTPGKVFRRLPGGLWRNMVSEVFRRLPGEASGDFRERLPEVRRRPGRRPGGGQEEAREDFREEAREDSREAREDSPEEAREDSREEPGGGQSVVVAVCRR